MRARAFAGFLAVVAVAVSAKLGHSAPPPMQTVGADLSHFLKSARVVGRGASESRADVGDVIEWTLSVTNRGVVTAEGVTLSDALSPRVSYVEGSLRLDGRALTDRSDADEGEALDRRVSVRLGFIDPGQTHTLSFLTRVDAGPEVVNQAQLFAAGLPSERSDADGDDLNGDAPTRVTIGRAPTRALAATLNVSGAQAAIIGLGDAVAVEVGLRNVGTVAVEAAVVEVEVPEGLAAAALTTPEATPGRVDFGPRLWRWSGVSVSAGASAVLSAHALVGAGPSERCFTARFAGAGVAMAQTPSACLEVRGGPRGRSGRVFEDVDDDGRYTQGVDLTHGGLRVSAVAAGGPSGAPTTSASTAPDGTFALEPLAAGPLELSVRSASGVLWRRTRLEGDEGRFDIAVTPSGRVYDAVSGRTLDGARVRVVRMVAGRLAPVEPGDLEDASQADQVTSAAGAYRVVALRQGDYALIVEDGADAYTWPSSLRPALAVPPPANGVALARVSVPEVGASMPWTARLDAHNVPASLRRNHLPLDPRSALLRASARSLAPRVTRGQVATFEVDVQNASARDLRFDPTTGKGGLFVRATPDGALGYVPRSATWWRVEGGGERVVGAYEPAGGAALLFGATQAQGAARRARPIDLPAGQALRLRWQMAALGTARESAGVRVEVVGPDGLGLSAVSQVTLRITDDPVFDRGVALGRVYCDTDGNGRADVGERGVPGAVVTTQSGRTAVTDTTGRFSLDGLEAGGHVFKVDAEAAVPGATGASEGGVYRALTPGLPVQIELALRCDVETTSAAPPGAGPPLRVEWPTARATVSGETVPVWGVTLPGARVTLNGDSVDVDAEGHFAGAAQVSLDAPELEVIATHEGQSSTLRRAYVAARRHVFVVALAEGVGADRAETLRMTSASAGHAAGPLTLEGHAALTLRGYARGADILGGLFDRYRFTAQVDSRRDASTELARRLVDADRLYPVYGDDAAVADSPGARGPLYVLIEADESRLLVGELDVTLEGLGIFRYARRHTGAQVRLVRVPASEGARVRAGLEAFVAQREDALAHASVELAATGGALYFVPHRRIVPDSAQVWVVARDRTSGVEVARRRLEPGRDFTLRSAEGRLLLSRPLSVSAETGWAGTGVGGLRDGRRSSLGASTEQSLAIEYDHEETLGQPLDAVGAAGAHGRERWGDVALGGGLVEARSGVVGDGPYRLMGAELDWRPGRVSGLGVEVARSQSTGAGRLSSSDGGLSWSQRGSSISAAGRARAGLGLYVTGDFELADVLRDASEAHADDSLWRSTLTYRRLSADYSATGLGSGVDADALAVSSTARLTDAHALSVRLDAARGGEILNQRLELSHAWSVGATTWTTRAVDEQATDPTFGPPLTLTTLSEEAAVRLNGRWTLHAGQAVDVRGDDRVHASTADTLTTSVGASMHSPAGVTLELGERVRWSGANATEVGLRADLSERQSAYVQQRVDHSSTARDSAFVIGGEERWGADASGRTYGEYHAQSTGWGPAPGAATGQRAVLGLGKRTEVTRGLVLDATYERSQLVGRESARRSTDAVGAALELSRGHLRMTTRQEARVTDEDARFGLGDTLQVVSLNGAQWQVTTPLQLRGRADVTRTLLLEAGEAESASLELALGFAWRPLESGRLTVLGQWAKRAALTPRGGDVAPYRRQDELDVVSLTPMVELPGRLKLTEKVAWKRYALSDGGLPVRAARTLLWINRLDRHVSRRCDVGLEYRLLGASLAGERLHGALVELAYAVEGKVRLGGGWNFSHFSDEDLARPDASAGGAFVRVSAVY